MTTVIACRPSLSMVADSRISHGDGKFTSRKKIAKSGMYVAGVAGEYSSALTYLKKFLGAVKDGDGHSVPAMPVMKGAFELLVLSEFGLWIYGDDGSPIEVEEKFYAIGTGAVAATACMRTQEEMVGAYDLHLAMRIACDLDQGSGMPMVELGLRGKKRAGSTGTGVSPGRAP